jgi:ADP-L-glycero-D-manno-heptose 6-epimerase
MRIFVTGGTGFVGSNLVKELYKQGHEIAVTGSDAEQNVGEFVKKYLQPGLLGIDWSATGQIDVLYHEAAINDTMLNDREEMLRANLSASMELFEHAVENGCRKIVYASSTAVYGNAPAPFKEDGPIMPLNVYGESKKMLDEFATDFAIRNPEVTVVGLRYCNVYGPGEQHKGKRASMIYQLAQQMEKGSPKLFKYGEQKRDWIYVDDVVKANLLAAEAKESCIVNCGSGSATSFNEIVEILNRVMSVSRTPEYIDNPFAEKYQDFTYCDMSKAAEKIGFKPEYDIEKGIEHYYATGKLISN